MSWPNVLALAVFICVCGFIAYAGDILGRRMGKKRLSLFGMRPRYTAIVTTTITGMLIASFTIGTVSIANKEIGNLVLRGAEILRAQEREIAQQRSEAEQARKEAQKAEQERDKLYEEVDKLNAQIARLETDVRRREADLSRAQKQLADAKQQISNLNHTIAERQAEIEAQRKAIERVSDDLEMVRGDLARSQADLARAQEGLADARDRLAQANEEVERRRQEIDRHKQEIARQQTEIADLKGIRDRLMAEIELVRPAVWEVIALREKDIIFRSTEELARRAIRSSQSKSEIRRELLSLLSQAGRRAKEEGAAVGENGRAIKIIPKRVVGSPSAESLDDDGYILAESESIDALVDNIWLSPGSVVVLVLAITNSVRGEQALVDLVSYHNQLIYAAGEEVASTVIDGGKSHGAIFSQLATFLRNDVRAAAIERRVIPVYDKDGLSVGALAHPDDWDKILDMVLHIKELDRRVRVTAVAENDIWSEGPLVVDFVVSDPT